MRRSRVVLGLMILAVIAVTLSARLSASPRIPHARQITLLASQWRYSPGIVTVNEGDPVTLILKSDDVVHGVYVDGYGVSGAVRPGETSEIHFVATKAGRWMFRCTTTCGPFHPYMIGWLRVQPNLALRLGWVAVAGVGAAALFMAWGEARRR